MTDSVFLHCGPLLSFQKFGGTLCEPAAISTYKPRWLWPAECADETMETGKCVRQSQQEMS